MWSSFYWAYSHMYPNMSQANRNKWDYHLSGVPIYGWALKAQQQMDYLNDYMKNRNIGWEDLKYPALAPGAGAGVSALTSGVGGVLFTSSNLARFYGRGYVPDRGYRGFEYA